MWIDTEVEAYNWFKEKYDDKAQLCGGSDSTLSDIYSPKLNTYIEIKQLMPSARCGQFTANTADSDVCKSVLNGNLSSENAKSFVKIHYLSKNVGYFLIKNKNGFFLEELNTFIKNHTFSWQSYGKKSGTTTCPKKYIEQISIIFKTELRNNKLYIKDESLVGQYFWLDNIQFFISKSKASYGEIRKCSKTKNLTWLVEVS